MVVKNLKDFKEICPMGIIVNYDKRCTYRCSTESLEEFANNIEYPYIQRYQKGIDPRTKLFIIKDKKIYRLERIKPSDPNSPYKMIDIDILIDDMFYSDSSFDKEMKKPIIINEEPLRIEE